MKASRPSAVRGLLPLVPALLVACASPPPPRPQEIAAPSHREFEPPTDVASTETAQPGVVPPESLAQAEAGVTPHAGTSTADPSATRITSIGMTTWIRKRPEVKEGEFLGYVRTGSSIALRAEAKVQGPGCPRGFYQVEPRGYVCDDRTVTTTPRKVFSEAAEATRGRAGPFPFRYALSSGAPMYNRIPTAAEQERFERWLGKPGVHTPLPKGLRSHEELAMDAPIAPIDPVPSFLEGGGSAKEAPYDLVEQTIPMGAMLSFTAAFEANGRTWLLSTDHTIVPADRVRPFRPSTFAGVSIGAGGLSLPIAWVRSAPKSRYVARGEVIERAEGELPPRTYLEVTGRRVESGGAAFLETRVASPSGLPYLVDEADVVVTHAESTLPRGVKDGQKWILVRLSAGTLVAYEGLSPVFATLVSPGKGGQPVSGRSAVENATTPTGAYSMTFKDRAATMSREKGKNRSFWIQDVPHTMYFDPPFALHAAFWHERFGEFVSAGCVNLSPLDAEWVFDWSDPPVPPDWQGATGAGAKDNGPTTIVVIRR